ncbi:hypothetical protein HNR67_006909 [Crossiella cryophila]|uniref:Uncharacterized protein n=1 Tax=Crossiella cryophila TaxID=43355 RepID=A0A7W7CJ85_9PSEU|nr:hypothetical protein [Crossiella cryophila]
MRWGGGFPTGWLTEARLPTVRLVGARLPTERLVEVGGVEAGHVS